MTDIKESEVSKHSDWEIRQARRLKKTGKGCLIFIVVTGLIIFALSKVPPEERDSMTPEQIEEAKPDVAGWCAQDTVKAMLKVPGSADFPNQLIGVTANKDGSYLVNSYVNAQNAYGVLLRQNYTCKIKILDVEHGLCDSDCFLK